MNQRAYNTWVLFFRAPDVPGQWVAHCLDFDVVTQGNSLAHAAEMIVEAVGIVAGEDLKRGRDPLLHQAPEECWTLLWQVTRLGRREDVSKTALAPFEGVDEREVGIIAAQVHFEFTVVREAPSEEAMKPAWNVPLSFSRESAPPSGAFAC